MKRWPPGSIPSGHVLFIRVSENFAFRLILDAPLNVRGYIVNEKPQPGMAGASVLMQDLLLEANPAG